LAGAPFDCIQVTLVDCPGHASLIRTIVGGAQIINIMVLVIDVTKGTAPRCATRTAFFLASDILDLRTGIQTQTAECLVIGELVVDKLIVALNKVDLFPADSRAASLAKVQKGLAKVFEKTRFAGCPQVVVSARPGGGDGQPDTGAPPICAWRMHRCPNRNCVIHALTLCVFSQGHLQREWARSSQPSWSV
jgi:selenocysteine-specific elongation factor